jgi:ParB family transcriptional regulator, chromosome partitioning protein
MEEVKMISVEKLKLNPYRDSRSEFALQDLANSIRTRGIVNPLVVLPNGIVLDGSDRLRVARKIGMKEVPCIVRNLTFEQVKEFSIMHSKKHVATEPKDYQTALKRLLEKNPDITIEELACKINQTPEWVREKLNAKFE